MIVVDSSIWVDLFRDVTGRKESKLRREVRGEPIALTRFHQLELLQGCRDETEWDLLSAYLAAQTYLEAGDGTWENAARMYFELRRAGRTVRGPIDCCIAQIAMDHGALLLHRDRDFETIAMVRPLRHRRLRW